MRKFRLAGVLAAAGLFGWFSQAEAQVLKGQLKGFKPETGFVSYTPDGSAGSETLAMLTFDADGRFVVDTPLPEPALDAMVFLGKRLFFGVHLTDGKTTEMTISKEGDNYRVDFKGPDTDISRFVNRSAQAFDYSRYWAYDTQSKPLAEYRTLLDSEYKEVVKLLPTIENEKQREYYARLTDMQYRYLKLRLILNDAQNRHSEDYRNNAEYKELVKDIDPNDKMNFMTGLSQIALNDKVKAEKGGSNEAYCLEMINVVDKYVTLPALRSQMVGDIGLYYFIGGDGSGDPHAFISKYMKFAGKDSLQAKSMVDIFLEREKSIENLQQGTPAPDISLMTVDGKTVRLSDIVKGKFTYIDIWSTSCGPCLKEMPYVAKLVEKYKENDKVQFISISMDEKADVWKKKLEKDKPQWAQYLLFPEDIWKFNEDWGIVTIPRFIMIDKDGNIFSRDASKPSDEKTVSIIEEQINK